jgi:hypothetical protein
MRPGATIATAGLLVLALCDCQGRSGHESAGKAGSHASSGSSAISTSLDEVTSRRADAACRPDATWIASHPNAAPVPGFNYSDPDPSLLPKVATHLQKAPIYHGLAGTLAALDPPTKGAPAWRRLVADAERFEKISARQIADARRSDATAWTKDLAHKQALLKTLDADIEAAGFTVGDPCWVVYHS